MTQNHDDFDTEIQSDELSACEEYAIRKEWEELAAYDVEDDDAAECDYLTEEEWQALLDKAFDTSED